MARNGSRTLSAASMRRLATAGPARTPSDLARVRWGRYGRSSRGQPRSPSASSRVARRAPSSSPLRRTPSHRARGRATDGNAPPPAIDDVERIRRRPPSDRPRPRRRRSVPRRSGQGSGGSGGARRGAPSERRARPDRRPPGPFHDSPDRPPGRRRDRNGDEQPAPGRRPRASRGRSPPSGRAVGALELDRSGGRRRAPPAPARRRASRATSTSLSSSSL